MCNCTNQRDFGQGANVISLRPLPPGVASCERIIMTIEQDEIEAIEAPQIQDNDHNENLLELIDQLPDIDKQAIYLFYLEEMTISQIANVLQIPAGTVKSRLNRSRKNLQKMATERSAKEGK